MKRISRWVDNIGVKLIALFVALFIWFNASGQQDVKRNYVASLNFVNIPDTLTIAGRVPTDVNLSITGTRRELLFLKFKKINVMVNMARSVAGRSSQRLAVSDILLPPGIEPGDIRILSPTTIDVVLQRVVTKSVKVTLTFAGSLPSELLFNETPRVEPGEVVLSGPEGAVGAMDQVSTKPIDLSRIRESFQREIDIEYDGSVFLCTPSRVSIAVSVSPKRTRVLTNIPPTVLMDADDLFMQVLPKTVSLTLEGPQAVIDTLSSGDVSVLVDLSGKGPGRYTLAPDIIVPEGVQRYSLDVDSLRIMISRNDESHSM